MKILHLINTLSAGGAELHLLTLGRHLKRRGLEVVVACLREQVKDSRSLLVDFENEGIRVVRLEADGRYDLRFVATLASLLKKERPAILHTHLPRADLAGAFGRLLCPSVFWVSSVHDIHDKSWSGRRTLPLFNFIWRRADRIVAISHAVKDWLVKERCVPDEKITVIHYGIEPERFSRTECDLRESWGLAGKIIIGAIGRLEPRKGHDCLIRAMSVLKKAVPNVCLVIVGHDLSGYRGELQLLINDLDLKEQVRLVGFQSDIAGVLAALDVFAFSTHSEGFGQVVIEAMAAGKPVVVSNLAPLTEIVTHGETGLLVKPDDPQAFADAIVWLLNHPEEAQQIAKRGQETVYSYFSARRMAEQIVTLYNELMDRKPDPENAPHQSQEVRNVV